MTTPVEIYSSSYLAFTAHLWTEYARLALATDQSGTKPTGLISASQPYGARPLKKSLMKQRKGTARSLCVQAQRILVTDEVLHLDFLIYKRGDGESKAIFSLLICSTPAKMSRSCRFSLVMYELSANSQDKRLSEEYQEGQSTLSTYLLEVR